MALFVQVVFTVTRSGGSIGELLVNYTVGGGSAILGTDYQAMAASG